MAKAYVKISPSLWLPCLINILVLLIFLFFPSQGFAQGESKDALFENPPQLIENVILNIKKNTLRRSVFFNLAGDVFTLFFPRDGAKKPTSLYGRRYSQERFPLAENQVFINGVFEFEIADASVYNPIKPLRFHVRDEQSQENTALYYWSALQQRWIFLPEQEYKDGVFSGLAYVPKLQIALLKEVLSGKASWYVYKGCDCTASPDFPKGSRLLVRNLANEKSVTVTVNDYGPDRIIHPDRVVDLDLVAFEKIAKKRMGVITVQVEYLDNGEEERDQ